MVENDFEKIEKIKSRNYHSFEWSWTTYGSPTSYCVWLSILETFNLTSNLNCILKYVCGDKFELSNQRLKPILLAAPLFEFNRVNYAINRTHT